MVSTKNTKIQKMSGVDFACYTRCFDHCDNKALLMISKNDKEIIKLCACVGHIRLDIILPSGIAAIEAYGNGDFRKELCPIEKIIALHDEDATPATTQDIFRHYYFDMINTDIHKYTMTTLSNFYAYPTDEEVEKMQTKPKGVDLSEFAWL